MLVVIAALVWLAGLVGQTLGLVLVIVAVLLEGFEIWLWIKYLKRFRVSAGVEAMIGETATAADRLNPEGTVYVHGEIWRAHCPEGAVAGEAVVIREVDGLLLRVAPIEDAL